MERLRYWVLDEDGEPLAIDDVLAWAEWCEQPGHRQLAFDVVGGAAVSTVFLGVDHAVGFGPPVLWETLVLGSERDGEIHRYRSRAEALTGHAQLVAAVRADGML